MGQVVLFLRVRSSLEGVQISDVLSSLEVALDHLTCELLAPAVHVVVGEALHVLLACLVKLSVWIHSFSILDEEVNRHFRIPGKQLVPRTKLFLDQGVVLFQHVVLEVGLHLLRFIVFVQVELDLSFLEFVDEVRSVLKCNNVFQQNCFDAVCNLVSF